MSYVFPISVKKAQCTWWNGLVCQFSDWYLHQFPDYINAGPNLSKIIECLCMFAFALIAKKYSNVSRCESRSENGAVFAAGFIATTWHCCYGRTWNNFSELHFSSASVFLWDAIGDGCHQQLLKMPFSLQNIPLSSVLSQPFPSHYSTNQNPFILPTSFHWSFLHKVWWIWSPNTCVYIFLFIKQMVLYNSSVKYMIVNLGCITQNIS